MRTIGKMSWLERLFDRLDDSDLAAFILYPVFIIVTGVALWFVLWVLHFLLTVFVMPALNALLG